MTSHLKQKKELILKYIWKYPGKYRKMIAKELNLRLNLVSDAVNSLIEDGWVREGTIDLNGRGRNPLALFIENEKRAVAVATFDRREICCAIVNSCGSILKISRQKNESDKPEEVLDLMSEMMIKLIKSFDGNVFGVGMADPGMVDYKTGTVLKSSLFPKWRNLRVTEILEQKIKLPVITEDSTRVKAYGEYLKRPECRKDGKNAVVIDYGDLLGCVLINANGIFRGAGFAGEIGHVVFDPAGKYCRCGARGCLEMLSVNDAVLEKTKERLKIGTDSILKGLSPLDAGKVFEAYLGNDRLAGGILQETLKELGLAVSIIASVFHPDCIIVLSNSETTAKAICKLLKEETRIRLLPELSSTIEFDNAVSSGESILSGIGLMFFDSWINGSISSQNKENIL